MAISSNIFEKCLPAIGTDIKRCGTVTVCNVSTPTADELSDIYTDGSGNFRLMDALFMQDFEIKACGATQNGLYDFLMANKVNMSKRINKVSIGKGRYQIMPFILAQQKSVYNNEYWTVSGGTSSGGNWQVDVASQTDVPVDVRWFNAPERVFIFGKTSGGTQTSTAWRIVSSSIVSSKVRLILASENTNSALSASKIESPVNGVLIRGTGNINDYEAFCEQGPGVNLNKMVPFFHETNRLSLCDSELYQQYRDAIIDNNPYYAKFGDIPEVELNAQLGADYQRRFVNNFFYNKPLDNQDMNSWTSLEDIVIPDATDITIGDEGKCVGKRANAVGVYEQMASCGRVKDLQGETLNLPELFRAIYAIQRVREGLGENTEQVDLMTDSFFAAQIHTAMIRYFNSKSEGLLRMNIDLNGPDAKRGNFGFRFRSYQLIWPNVTLNVISHKFFDDRVSALKAVGDAYEASGRSVWIIDWAGVYPAELATNRVVNNTGDLKTLAAINSTFACVMKVPTRKQTLTSTTYTVVVECPQSSLILENISSDVPEAVYEIDDLDYYGAY